MRRLLASGVAVAATLVLAACGSSGSNSSTTSAPAGGGTAVSVKSIDGKNVLVDAAGKALYASDQEATGKVLCTTSACTAFWKPLTTTNAKPTASSNAGKIGVIKRPDGSMQIAVDGRPLYTFSEDSAGKIAGDGFSDDFSGQHFTWHAVMAGGQTSSGSGGSTQQSQPKSNGYGY